jgi:hypothetical protein
MMGIINNEQAKEIVKKALRSVGDFNTNNIENFSFSPFNNFQKNLFLKNLSTEVTAAGFYITLNPGSADNWKVVSDCINYVENNIFPQPV